MPEPHHVLQGCQTKYNTPSSVSISDEQQIFFRISMSQILHGKYLDSRTGKNRDLFKKIRDTKGKFHAKMGSIMVWT